MAVRNQRAGAISTDWQARWPTVVRMIHRLTLLAVNGSAVGTDVPRVIAGMDAHSVPGYSLAPDFETHVEHRLRQGAGEYRDRSYGRPVDDLLVEILEEASDIATWGRITATVLERKDLNLDQRRAIACALLTAEQHARSAWRTVNDALRIAQASPGDEEG